MQWLILHNGILQRRRCQRGAVCWCTAWQACRAASPSRWRTSCSGTGCACVTPSSWCAAARPTSRPTSTSCASCTPSSVTSASTSTAPAWVRSAMFYPTAARHTTPHHAAHTPRSTTPGPARNWEPASMWMKSRTEQKARSAAKVANLGVSRQVLEELGVETVPPDSGVSSALGSGVARPTPLRAPACGCAPPLGVSPDSGIEFDRWSAARDTPQWQFFTPPLDSAPQAEWAPARPLGGGSSTASGRWRSPVT